MINHDCIEHGHIAAWQSKRCVVCDSGFEDIVEAEEPVVAMAFEDIPAGAPVTIDYLLGLASRTRGDDGEPLD